MRLKVLRMLEKKVLSNNLKRQCHNIVYHRFFTMLTHLCQLILRWCFDYADIFAYAKKNSAVSLTPRSET